MKDNLNCVKRTLVGLLLIALSGSISGFAQSNFTGKVIGVGVVVADLERSLDFYVNGIGMVKTGNFTINDDFGKRSGLTNGIATNVTILKLENSPEATDWKLMSFGKKDPDGTFIKLIGPLQ